MKRKYEQPISGWCEIQVMQPVAASGGFTIYNNLGLNWSGTGGDPASAW